MLNILIVDRAKTPANDRVLLKQDNSKSKLLWGKNIGSCQGGAGYQKGTIYKA